MKRLLTLVAALGMVVVGLAPAHADATAVASGNCTITYATDGGVMADTSTATVAAGATLHLRSILYGPGDFNGWYTDPFTWYAASPETSTFVSYGQQDVSSLCTAGSAEALYAHWEMPPTSSASTSSTSTLHLTRGTYFTAFNVTGCASGCPLNLGSLSAKYSVASETLTALSGSSIVTTATDRYSPSIDAYVGAGSHDSSNTDAFEYAFEIYKSLVTILKRNSNGTGFTSQGTASTSQQVTLSDGSIVKASMGTSNTSYVLTYSPGSGSATTDSMYIAAMA